MLFAYKKVFSNTMYVIAVVIIAAVVFSLLVLLPNLDLLIRVAVFPSATFFDFVSVTTGLIFSFTASFTISYIFYVASISLLFGINIAMVVFYIKMSKKLPKTKETIASIGGMTGGILGVGCVACGSIALSPLLSLLGVSATVSFIPFGGSLFRILGISALLFSIVIISKRIQKGNTC